MKRNIIQSPSFWLYAQLAALMAGNYVGWSTIFKEIRSYCESEGGRFGALLSFSGTAEKNPLLTPCFWGSIAFLIAFAWTISIIMEKEQNKKQSSHKKIVILLAGGTLFALVNNLPIFYKYLTQPKGQILSCSADKITNPWVTSCFLGFTAFALSLLASVLAMKTFAHIKNTPPQD